MLRDKLKKNVARITGPFRLFDIFLVAAVIDLVLGSGIQCQSAWNRTSSPMRELFGTWLGPAKLTCQIDSRQKDSMKASKGWSLKTLKIIRELKDVRAHCYCASLVRTLFIDHARATSFSSARTESKTQELMTFALTWCPNIFVGRSVTPTFFSADRFLFWLFPSY